MQYLISDLAESNQVPVSGILTHREIRATDCPGAHLQDAVDQLRRSMASPLAGGHTGDPTVRVSGS